MKPAAVIFDMDGVIFNTEVLFDEAWRQAARQMHIADIEPAIRDCRGVTPAIIREYFAREYSEVDYGEFDRLNGEIFQQLIANGVPLMKGVRETLTNLRSTGIKTAVATSGVRERAMHHLAEAGIDSLFDAIITGDMVAHSKPAPDIYLTAAQALGVNPVHCIGVEDSHNGVRSAHAAGMKVAMVIDQMPATEEIRALCRYVFDNMFQLNDELSEMK